MCRVFVLATRSNVGNGACLLQMCYKCTNPHHDTMGRHTGQVWVGTVRFEVTGWHDTKVKIAKVQHNLNMHVDLVR